MKTTLGAAGLPQSILNACTDVVKTCRECRAWEAAGKALQQTTTLSTFFNENVETDCLFVLEYTICHYVDRCTRFHAGGRVASRTEDDLFQALYCHWIGIHGPMQNLITDGETALNTDTAKARLQQESINLKTRASGQHARFAERHGAMLRVVLHLMIEELKRQRIERPFETILAMAFFVLNAFTSVGGKTPHQAVYGRQPGMLPPIEGVSRP